MHNPPFDSAGHPNVFEDDINSGIYPYIPSFISNDLPEWTSHLAIRLHRLYASLCPIMSVGLGAH